MKAGALALLGIVISSLAVATPPERGGVMFGCDSSLVLYWTHPELNCYEQGHDDGSENTWLVGGEDPGSYAMAVEFRVPFAAYIKSIRIKISPTDHYVGQPGNQFSPFRIAVHRAAADSSLQEPPLYEGSGRLCDGVPCLDGWFEQPLDLSHLTTGELWQAFQWMDSTPAAPEVMGRSWRMGDPLALMGIGEGSNLTWSIAQYIPVFRQRLLGIIPLDTAVAVGWRQRLPVDNPPDSFVIFGFLGDTAAAEFVHADTDTLMHRIVDPDFDSICIHSCYGGLIDDSARTVTLEESKRPPLLADIVFPDSKMNPSAMLHIANLAPEPISLRLGYDPETIVFDVDSVSLAGYETKLLPGVLTQPSDDTIDVMILVTDDEGRYYPLIVQSTYPQPGQTDVAGNDSDNATVFGHPLKIYPNPCFRRVTIADDNFRAVREIAVYNVIGQKIIDISPPFSARMTWNGCDREGRAAPPGIYFVRVSYDDAVVTKSVLLMR